MNFFLLAVSVTSAVSTMTVLVMVATRRRTPAEARLLQEVSAVVASGNAKYEMGSFVAFVMRPLIPLRDWLKAQDADLAYRLSLAGLRKPEHINAFVTAKLLCPAIAVLLATFFAGPNWMLASLLAGGAAFFAPDVFLIRATTRRRARISEALPDFMDLLTICIDAGLGMDQSVLKIAKELKPVCPELSDELTVISREQRAGRPRLEAWRSMAERINIPIVRQFVGMLTQSEKFGTPVARSLAVFAEALRTNRTLQAEELAAKTAIKLVFPLMFCIFPAMFVVLLGPAVLSIMKAFAQ